MNINWHDFILGSSPVLAMVALGLLVMTIGFFVDKGGEKILLCVSLVGIAGIFSLSVWLWRQPVFHQEAMISVDPFAYYLYFVILLIGFLTCLNHYEYFRKQGIHYPEIYSLTLFAISGMMLMVSTTHLILFFLALEVMSLAVYILVGIKRRDLRSNEGAMKYFILGAMVAGIFLYGAALIYGTTGSFDLRTLDPAQLKPGREMIFQIGVLLVLIAFAFKVAAVPFHFWTPDVYEGAPISVTGFMATAVKAAAFGGFLRVLFVLIPFSAIPIPKILEGLSLATMIVGNLVALYQTNVKRMLAYSSIAHAGYILVGVTAAYAGGAFHPEALAAPLFYLLAYAAMTLGAFAVASVVATDKEDCAEYNYYLGLGQRSPKLAAAMAIFMVALTGIPPTVGFAGKFFLFREAIHQGLYNLVVVGVIMSAVSAYYYLRVIVNMYFSRKEAVPLEGPDHPAVKPALALVILFCVLTTFYMGLDPSRSLKITSLSGFYPQKTASVP